MGDQGTGGRSNRSTDRRRQAEFPHHFAEGRKDHATSLGGTAAALCSGEGLVRQGRRRDVQRAVRLPSSAT